MRIKVHPYDNSADERSQYLSCHKTNRVGPIARGGGEPESDGGVQMRCAATACHGRKDARHNRECPTCRYHDPARTGGLRSVQQHVCDDTIPEQYQNQRSTEFAKKRRDHWLGSSQSNERVTAFFQLRYKLSLDA